MTKRRAAIVSPLRTPVGRFLGALAPLTAGDLGAAILKALIERSGLTMAARRLVIGASPGLGGDRGS